MKTMTSFSPGKNENNVDKSSHIYEFIDVPTYVDLVSSNSNDPIYIIRVLEKGKVGEKLNDHFSLVIFPNEYYLIGGIPTKGQIETAKEKEIYNS